MNEQTKFINDMLDTKIKHFERRMDSAKRDVECYDTMSIVQNSAYVISECATALELLGFVKDIVRQSENFAKQVDKGYASVNIIDFDEENNARYLEDLDI